MRAIPKKCSAIFARQLQPSAEIIAAMMAKPFWVIFALNDSHRLSSRPASIKYVYAVIIKCNEPTGASISHYQISWVGSHQPLSTTSFVLHFVIGAISIHKTGIDLLDRRRTELALIAGKRGMDTREFCASSAFSSTAMDLAYSSNSTIQLSDCL